MRKVNKTLREQMAPLPACYMRNAYLIQDLSEQLLYKLFIVNFGDKHRKSRENNMCIEYFE